MDANVQTEAKSQEADFRLNDLFFSRTDMAGIIKAGNSVFQCVSEYECDELWNKPHKLIRHPDTPRGVFYKLWSSIKAGQPIGAYVKNKTKSGKYYWVYAAVTPIEGGYLSIRLKPSSELFEKIRQFYIRHSERERREKIDPADSAAMIDEALAALGFESYDAFMSQALKIEQESRDTGLGREISPLSHSVDKLQQSAKMLSEGVKAISASLDSVKNTPFNLRIFASQMADEGEGVAVIAANYVSLLDELRAILDGFDAAASAISNSLDDAMLFNVIVKLQREMVTFFRAETEDLEGVDRAIESDHLACLSTEYSSREQAALRTIRDHCSGLPSACAQMKRQATALDVIRLMAKVEMSNKDQNDGIILELEQRLEACQETLQAALNDIARESVQTLSAIRDIMRIDEIARRNAGTSQELAKAG